MTNISTLAYSTTSSCIFVYSYLSSAHVVVVVFFFEYNKSWTSVNSILLRYNGVGKFNCRSFGITEL